MRLVEIFGKNEERLVINVDHISSFRIEQGTVCLLLASGESVHTLFTTIEAAVDFLYRSQSLILRGGNE